MLKLFRKLNVLLIILFMFVGTMSTIYAETNTGQTINNEIDFGSYGDNNLTNSDINETSDDTGGKSSLRIKSDPFSEHLSVNFLDSGIEVPESATRPFRSIVEFIVKLFLSSVSGILLIITVIDCVAILLHVTRAKLGVESSGSGTGMDGSSSRRIRWVSQDCVKAISMAEGGSGDLGGFDGDSKGKINVWLVYGQQRATTIILGLVIVTVLLSPQLLNIAVLCVNMVLGLLNKLIASLSFV